MKYSHKVQYYETDKMGVVHHSNYIRWMEEARTALLEEIGFSYTEFEKMGCGSPVISVSCRYISPARYGDTVAVELAVTGYTGARVAISYTMTNSATGERLATGESQNCFVDSSGRPFSLRKRYPEFDKAFSDALRPAQ